MYHIIYHIIYHIKNKAPTGRIFVKFNISVFFEYSSRKLKFHYKLTKKGVLYMKTDIHSVLLRMRDISDRSCRQNQNTSHVQ
jgi:hypothetical protein